MTKTIPTLWFVTLISIPITLLAGGRGDAILGGAVGGALGAAVGSELGGRDGAIVGSAIGGATGTALATQRYRRPQREVIYVDRYQYTNRPVYVAPRDYDYGPPPSYYHRPGRHRGHYRHYHDWD
ncbi:hypothetical protein [Candidatus Contendibacter odensensis]|uniref:Glycine zipper domain-containing protein n=1 Tax=Candidatus Contendobacter odensis Run_B_J11 TaxID=1400861 RepID=A0A7U7GA38_9GAMM|nr:hypothetical protein [Candidatus Contendobacter odensis]MBK8752800.1 hypothetical protein [Candidatus Competibacteraceae bacterium]CDH44361.1 conserved exported hypothetical protein [Candidatus Contendobacter odensis Run_B_J11]